MLKLSKFILLIFLVVLFTQLAFFILPAGLTLAAESIEPPEIKIHIGGFTGSEFQPVSTKGQEVTVAWISQYVAAVYRYGIGLAAILATVMIMVGGFLWLTSGGSPDRVGKAKEFITGALTGLLLALFSFMILYTVNPQLVALSPLKISKIPEIGLGFGSGAEAEVQAASRDLINYQSFSGLSNYVLLRLDIYQKNLGAVVTCGFRPGEDRHGSGYVVDMRLREGDALYNYVTTNNTRVERLSWGTAYHLPDGTVFVDEPAGSARHWHVEFVDGINWQWQPEWPH